MANGDKSIWEDGEGFRPIFGRDGGGAKGSAGAKARAKSKTKTKSENNAEGTTASFMKDDVEEAVILEEGPTEPTQRPQPRPTRPAARSWSLNAPRMTSEEAAARRGYAEAARAACA